MKYLAKQAAVDAFIYYRNNRSSHPDWFRQAVGRPLSAGKSGVEFKNLLNQWSVELANRGASVCAREGDWVVRHQNGEFSTYSREEFDRTYTEEVTEDELKTLVRDFVKWSVVRGDCLICCTDSSNHQDFCPHNIHAEVIKEMLDD